MVCQELALARAICRVTLSTRDSVPGTPDWVAEVDLIDLDGGVSHPVVLPGGRRIAFPGATEAAALSAAVTFLAEEFGGFSEQPHACVDFRPLRPGSAHVVSARS